MNGGCAPCGRKLKSECEPQISQMAQINSGKCRCPRESRRDDMWVEAVRDGIWVETDRDVTWSVPLGTACG